MGTTARLHLEKLVAGASTRANLIAYWNSNADILDTLVKGTGLSGGQSVIGGTGSGDDLTLRSTSHATKGSILIGTSVYDEVNNRLGIGGTPNTKIHIATPVENGIDSVLRVGAYLDIMQTFFGSKCFIGGNCRLSTSSATTNKFIPSYNPGYGMLMEQDYGNAIQWYGINWNSSSVEKELSDFILAMSLTYNGNLWVAGDVNCASVTDHTPHFLGDALAAIRKIKAAKNGEIDHASLPDFAINPYQDKKGEWWPGRSLGDMVSVLTVAIQQLAANYDAAIAERDLKIEKLSKRIDALAAEIEKY
jgi:hypothetical protein